MKQIDNLQARPPASKGQIAINVRPPPTIPYEKRITATFGTGISEISSKLQQNSNGINLKEIEINESRMKLRDYLFLAKTSSNKTAAEKRKLIQKIDASPATLLKMKESKGELRKNKYHMENKQMFTILKRQINLDLEESIQQIEAIKRDLKEELQHFVVPENQQMVKMYQIRDMAREKLKGVLQQIKNTLKMNIKDNKESDDHISYSGDSQISEQFVKDKLINQNCISFSKRLKNR